MTRNVIFAMLIITGVVIACKKSSDSANNGKITGKWKLTEYYMDPGDGSGTWQPASNFNNNQTIEFKPNGIVVTNTSLLTTYDRYYIGTDSFLYMIRTSFSDTVRMGFQISQNKLAIYPMCIEGCGFRYKRLYGL
jgi:hypothetical protein